MHSAGRLRGELIGLINRASTNPALEVKDDLTPPRDLDAQVLAHLELLEKTNTAAAAKGKTAGGGGGAGRRAGAHRVGIS